MRILHLTVSAARGGRRDAILTLINNLRPLGAECGVVALRNPSTDVSDLQPQVDYVHGMGLVTRPTFSELAEVRRICRSRQVDVIHAHDAGGQYVASMLRIASPSLRVVMTFHRTLGIDSDGARNWVRNALFLPLVHRVVTASEERRKYLLSKTLLPPSKVQVIPFGVDLDVYHPDPSMRSRVREELGLRQDTLLVVTIGHLGSEKGIDQVIQGLSQAATQLDDLPWHLVVLGTGPPERLTLLRDAAAQALGDRVTFAGFRSDVPRWLQAADLLIHAPRMEAFGLVVVQALACGLPVVATAVGGLPEIIEQDVSGRLVPLGDARALGDAIALLLSDPPTRCRLSHGALTHARSHLDARQTAQRHFALYRELLNDR